MSTVVGAGPPRVHPRGVGGVLASSILSGRCPAGPTATEFLMQSTPTPCEVLHFDHESFDDEPRLPGTSTSSRMHSHPNASTSALSLYAVFASFFDALRSVYLPFLWESLVAGFAVMRYALLGQLLEQGKSLDESQSAGAVTSSMVSFVIDPTAASCLTCLALFAFVAMAVHPEGLTWVVVRRVRDTFMTFLQSSTTCWSWLVNDDTGVISTVLALATFGTLIFFCYVLHRTLAPKQPRSPQHKKNKTAAAVETPFCTESQLSTEDDSKPPVIPSPSRKRKKKKSSAKKRTGATANETPPAESTTTVSSREEEPLSKPPLPCPTIPPRVSAKEKSLPAKMVSPAPLSCKTESPPRDLPAVPKPTRVRVESTSTVDTAALTICDEESSSVVSSQHPNKQARNQPRPKRNPNQAGGRARNNNGAAELVISSRWDALKPETPSAIRAPRKQTLKSPSTTPNRAPHSGHRHQNQNCRPTESVQEESTTNQSFFSVESPRESPTNLACSPSPTMRGERTHAMGFPQLQPSTTVLPPPQTTSSSFFSDLNPRTPPFAPTTPPKVLRAPPGLALPEQTVAQTQTSSFFLPPAYRSSFDSFSPCSLISPPPGLVVSPQTTHTGATLPNGSCSPLCLRPSVGAVRDNPFEDEESEAQIEAELQELGGRMIENVLDF